MKKMPDVIFASIKHKWDDCLTGNWTTLDENTALTSYTRTDIIQSERAAMAAEVERLREVIVGLCANVEVLINVIKDPDGGSEMGKKMALLIARDTVDDAKAAIAGGKEE